MTRIEAKQSLRATPWTGREAPGEYGWRWAIGLIPPGNGQNPYGQRPPEVPLCPFERYPFAILPGTPLPFCQVPPKSLKGYLPEVVRGTSQGCTGVPHKGW